MPRTANIRLCPWNWIRCARSGSLRAQRAPLRFDHPAKVIEQLRVTLGQDFHQVRKRQRRRRARIQ